MAVDPSAMAVPTARQPTESEWTDLLLAWRVYRHVKSNAVVIVRDGMAVGVRAGQMSRVEAAQLAVQRAGDRVGGAVAASDAFFPMPDGLQTLGRAGVAAVIQPGGSKKDPEVTAAADQLDMPMVHAGGSAASGTEWNQRAGPARALWSLPRRRCEPNSATRSDGTATLAERCKTRERIVLIVLCNRAAVGRI